MIKRVEFNVIGTNFELLIDTKTFYYILKALVYSITTNHLLRLAYLYLYISQINLRKNI